MTGLISVIIPTRNRAELLEAAIGSVAGQDYRPLEVIVVDDGSLDDTASVVTRLASLYLQDLPVRYVQQNWRGAAAARNRGLDLAAGDLVQFLDSDDLLLAGSLSRRAAALAQDPASEIAYGDWLQGQSVAAAARFRRGSFEDPVVALLEGQWLPNFAYLARRAAVDRTGRWDEAIAVADDREFLMRLAIGCNFQYVAGLTGFYRWHAQQRLSRQDLAAYGAAEVLVLQRAEALLTEIGAFSEPRQRAMLAGYRALARKAVGKSDGALGELRRPIERLRDRCGAAPGMLEAALGFERSVWIEKHVLGLPRTFRRALVGRLPPATRRTLRLAANRLAAALRRKC